MTRLAIWSIGNHAKRNLLPAAAASEDIELVGILSRNAALVAEQCQLYGCGSWASAEEMLADGRVDAVLIAGPNGVHYAQGKQILAAGKHLWCEKSLTPSLEETKTLIGLAAEKGQVIAEAFMFLYHPQYAALRDLLQSGTLGKVISICSRFGFPHLPETDIRYSKELAGGALLDAGAYCVAAALNLLHKTPIAVSGHLVNPPEYNVDTGGTALLHFDGGETAVADWGFGRSYRNEVEIWCEGGFVRADRFFSKPVSLDTTIDYVLQRNNERHSIAVAGNVNHFTGMMETFSRAATDGLLRQSLADQALRQAQIVAAVRHGGFGLGTA